MNNKKICAIIIPVYKDKINRYEELSFRQCLKVLGNYKIHLLTHKNLDLSVYDKIAKEYKIQIDIVFFSESFFSGIAGYNELMKSKAFYKSFDSFEYILIYQLDAFVFRDELEYWCKQGYDYIGAPWITNKNGELLERKYWKVGNGGLSLRKVSYCIKVLSWKGPVLSFTYYKKLKYLPYMLGWQNNIDYFKKSRLNEDGLFSDILTPSYICPNIPTPEIASKFAFENPPSYMYQMCDRQLPFGCHAFLKYEYESFWKFFIEANINSETVNNNNKF